jgi:4-aminobutyrate aminotransferase-like enzyme
MQAFEMTAPDSLEPDPARAGAVLEAAKNHRLLVGKGGLYGNVIRLAPMLDVTDAEMSEGTAALAAAVADAD